MERKARNFYGIKNKKETNGKFLIVFTAVTESPLFGVRKPRVDLTFGNWLKLDILHSRSSRAFPGTQKQSKVSGC